MRRRGDAGRLCYSVKVTREMGDRLSLVALRRKTTVGDLVMGLIADRVNAAYAEAVREMAGELAPRRGK